MKWNQLQIKVILIFKAPNENTFPVDALFVSAPSGSDRQQPTSYHKSCLNT